MTTQPLNDTALTSEIIKVIETNPTNSFLSANVISQELGYSKTNKRVVAQLMSLFKSKKISKKVENKVVYWGPKADKKVVARTPMSGPAPTPASPGLSKEHLLKVLDKQTQAVSANNLSKQVGYSKTNDRVRQLLGDLRTEGKVKVITNKGIELWETVEKSRTPKVVKFTKTKK